MFTRHRTICKFVNYLQICIGLTSFISTYKFLSWGYTYKINFQPKTLVLEKKHKIIDDLSPNSLSF